jgi:Transposase
VRFPYGPRRPDAAAHRAGLDRAVAAGVFAVALSGDRDQDATLASLVTSFAALLAPDPGNDARLRQWITGARAADLPHLHSFTRGLDLDIQAATAALTMPHHNGRTEGVNTKTKMIRRQMYGRAGFTLLRHRILLG